jgi:hypothetical protein
VWSALLGAWILVASSAGPVAAQDDTAPSAPVRLAGDWYVLVHHREAPGEVPREAPREIARETGREGVPGDPSETGRDGVPEDPREQAERREGVADPSVAQRGDATGPVEWDDEIWRLDVRSDRLVWILHPHVVFRDASGRFVRLPSGSEARTAGAWLPSAAQRAEIARGLELDPHESRRKTLRPTEAGGFRSAGAMRHASASAIAYGETWAIEGPPARPVFVRHARLASGRTDPAEGRTTFTTRRVLAGGDELRGDYERDGRLVGEFRMIRMGVGEDARR